MVRAALICLIVFTVICGIIYPLSVTMFAQTAFPYQANATLDIIQLVCRAAMGKNMYSEIARVLSTAFSRSCAVFGVTCSVAPFEKENVDFFFDQNERAVAEWCAKNGKSAGRGTDTLREAKAIYFPVKAARRTFVVAFSCVQSKMTVTEKLVFSQIQTVLQVVL